MKADAINDHDGRTSFEAIGADAADSAESDAPDSRDAEMPPRLGVDCLRSRIDQLEKENRSLESLRKQAEQALALTRRQMARLLEENAPLRATAELNACELDKLGADLAKTEQALDEALHKLASAESALRQRQEENAQAWAELSPARQRIAEIEQELKDREATVSALENELAEANAWTFTLAGERREAEEKASRMAQALDAERHSRETAEQELGALQGLVSALEQQLATSDADLRIVEERRDEAYKEIAAITRFLRASEAATADYQAKYDWMTRVTSVMLGNGRWWSLLLPAKWHRRRNFRRLAVEQLFDAEAYLRRYPDVRASGQDPLRHFIAHGMAEGRQP